jgi:hypothetical protein
MPRGHLPNSAKLPNVAKCRVEGTDMMQARWVKEIGLGCALALATVVAGLPAQAQDDAVEPNSIWNLEQRVWGTIVRGLGLRDPNTPTIDYRERSPLVVPPTRDLPPPQAKAKPRDPAWPNDPDVARARKEAKRKLSVGNDLSRVVDNQGRPITPEELNRGGARPPASQSTASNAPAPGSDPDGRQIPPSEMGYFGGLFSLRAWGFSGYVNETGTFTNEPARTELTEPPPGYQTPSPQQPYGVTRRVERTKTEQFDPAGRNY